MPCWSYLDERVDPGQVELHGPQVPVEGQAGQVLGVVVPGLEAEGGGAHEAEVLDHAVHDAVLHER